MGTSFYKNVTTPIPDVEPVIHALFDLVSQKPVTETIGGREFARLALKHARAAEGETS